MEHRHIIIILLAIIIVLAAAIGWALFNPAPARQPVEIKITSDKSQYEDDANISVMLADLNKTPISKEIVNITITDSKGKAVVDNVVKTDGKGKASLELKLKKGKYEVNVTYGGNDNFTGSAAMQNLTIKEQEALQSQPARTSSGTHVVMGEDGYYARVDDNGNILENLGPSRKYYPNNPNAVDYPNAESMGKYVDKSRG